MVTFSEIGIDSLLVYILNSFNGDEKLCSKYHINNSEYYELCASDTYDRIIELSKEKVGKLSIFGIKKANTKIGFIVLLKDLSIMYSFGLHIQSRTEEIKKQLLDFISSFLNGNVKVFLYKKNIPAILFLLKNNYKTTKELVENNQPVLQLELCQ
jgi:hypothetical protein